MIKADVIKLINEATKGIIIPTIAPGRIEFYKAGVRDMLKQLQIQVDKMPEPPENKS